MESFCVVLFLILTSAYAVQKRLNSINELINCHQFEDTNILELLHWFAETVNINSNTICLTFDPNRYYGSHHYGNYEGMLDPLPRGYKYYTVGNIHKDTLVPLPLHAVKSQSSHDKLNRVRIIFSANTTGRIVGRVFITQHYELSDNQGTRYDPEHTYEITTNILTEFRRSTLREIQRLAHDSQLGPFGNTSSHFPSHSNQQRCTPLYDTRTNEGGCSNRCIRWSFFIFVAVVVVLVLLKENERRKR